MNAYKDKKDVAHKYAKSLRTHFITKQKSLPLVFMLHVTCAIIEHLGKILICQRSAQMRLPLKWEFPGGKIEDGESKEHCLIREIREELGLKIVVSDELSTVKYHYSDFSLCLYPFFCRLTGGELVITEHAQAIWVERNELLNYDWAEADVPIVEKLLAT